MNISASLLNNKRLLLGGNSVAASALRKDFAEILLDEELLTVKTKGSKRSYKAGSRLRFQLIRLLLALKIWRISG